MLWIVLLVVAMLFADVIIVYLLEFVVAPLFVRSQDDDPNREKQSLRRRFMPTNVRSVLIIMVVIIAGVVFFLDRKKSNSPIDTARDRFLDDVGRRAVKALEEHIPESQNAEKTISESLRSATDSHSQEN